MSRCWEAIVCHQAKKSDTTDQKCGANLALMTLHKLVLLWGVVAGNLASQVSELLIGTLSAGLYSGTKYDCENQTTRDTTDTVISESSPNES
eukprot:scaffold2863_cov114-Cylindrotheca_fusiformis.AAC.2